MGDMGLFQQCDWYRGLHSVLCPPNPLLPPLPDPPPLQFPRQVPRTLGQLLADNTSMQLAPWQLDLLQRLGLTPKDPLAEVRRQVQEWLDEYQPQAQPLGALYEGQLDAVLAAWRDQAAEEEAPQYPPKDPGRLAAWDQLVAHASDPYRYTPLED